MRLHYLTMTIQERIKMLIESLSNGNVSAFCRATGIKQPTMNTIIGSRQNNPSYEVLFNIANAESFNISAEWLLTGRGEMLKTSTPATKEQPSEDANRLLPLVESQQRTIENLARTIERLTK